MHSSQSYHSTFVHTGPWDHRAIIGPALWLVAYDERMKEWIDDTKVQMFYSMTAFAEPIFVRLQTYTVLAFDVFALCLSMRV